MSTPNAAKLIWNSCVDAELTYETVDAEFRTKTILEGVNYIFDEMTATEVITPEPPIAHAAQSTYPSRKENHEKSVRKLNADSSKAMGLLMSLFDPECNAHRFLAEWYVETIVPALLTPLELRRRDFNFRYAYEKWREEYRPDKQFNLDSVQKQWEALSDRNMPFAKFWGKWLKFVNQMRVIGHEPTEEKKYEQLRKAVTNANLRALVLQLSYSVAKRISIEDFFDNCLHVTRTDKDLDTGRSSGKRKAEEEAIVGRSVQVTKKPRGREDRELICWRCGEAGHAKTDVVTGARCEKPSCAICHAVIGVEPHDARSCCNRSTYVFRDSWTPKTSAKGREKSSSSTSLQSKGNGGRRFEKGKSSRYIPKRESASSISSGGGLAPGEINRMRALLAHHDASNQARANAVAARRVMSGEDSN